MVVGDVEVLEEDGIAVREKPDVRGISRKEKID
jgi:hypothetical protein